jgi:TM2 domain-containing membrane protein YozV
MIIILFAGFIFVLVYLIPAIVAQERKAKHAWGILLLDLLLGWTFIGWVVALVWAVSDSPEPRV